MNWLSFTFKNNNPVVVDAEKILYASPHNSGGSVLFLQIGITTADKATALKSLIVREEIGTVTSMLKGATTPALRVAS